MARVLVIGGSRFMGLRLVWHLLAAGHQVTTLNRGQHADPFAGRIARLRADRTSPEFLEALRPLSFDAAVDFAAFDGDDARGAVRALEGRVGHYIFISSGQVYLVREGSERIPGMPFTESAYAGRVMAAPEGPRDRAEWLYGVRKRDAEDVLGDAFAASGFPYTALRLPMVEGERDPSGRMESYLWRILDGHGVLVPDGGPQRLRHIYSGDVARAIVALLGRSETFGEAYNLCQEEMPTLREFLELLADLLGAPRRIQAIASDRLLSAGIRPEVVSPFSTAWMSLLDPGKAQRDLGFRHEPIETYLGHIVAAFYSRPLQEPPESYALRSAELHLLGT